VEGVDSDSHVEGVLSRGLCDVFVGADTGGFEGFGGELFVLVGNQVAAEWEFIDRGLLSS